MWYTNYYFQKYLRCKFVSKVFHELEINYNCANVALVKRRV